MLRSQLRKRSQSYALSATSLSGLFLGRPLLHGTRTRSKVSRPGSTSTQLAREMKGNPVPVYYQHQLHPLAHLGQSVLFSPFFAGTKPPSRNARDHKSFALLIQAREERLPDASPYPLLLPPLQPPPCHIHTPRIPVASPSTHNRCATHTGSRSFGHRPGDGRSGQAEVKAGGSFPTVHPSVHSLAPSCLKISQNMLVLKPLQVWPRESGHNHHGTWYRGMSISCPKLKPWPQPVAGAGMRSARILSISALSRVSRARSS